MKTQQVIINGVTLYVIIQTGFPPLGVSLYCSKFIISYARETFSQDEPGGIVGQSYTRQMMGLDTLPEPQKTVKKTSSLASPESDLHQDSHGEEDS